MLSIPEIVEAAEELLSQRFGGKQTLDDAVDLGGSGSATVLRCKVAQQPYLENRSVVIKFTPTTGDPFDDAALIREVVSYQFTTSLPTDHRPGPELLAYDIGRRILVIGDCGDGETYFDLLECSSEEQRVTLYQRLGKAIGQMHAVTADREEHFEILLKRMLSRFPDTKEIHELRDATLTEAVDKGVELLKMLGVRVDPLIEEYIAKSKRRLITGQHRAFTPYDLSPDNILLTDVPRFLDYEWAGFRDATFDLAGVIAGFPQYVTSMPTTDEEADAFIQAWTDEVRVIWPNMISPERLTQRIIAALIAWALTSTAYLYHGSMNHLAQSEGVPEQLKEEIFTDSLLGQNSELGEHARADLTETFEALQRYCHRIGGEKASVAAEFAGQALEVIKSLARDAAQ